MSPERKLTKEVLTKEGLTPKIIKEELDGVYGQSSPSISGVKELVKYFRMSQKSLQDDARFGRYNIVVFV